ncbi:MAG: DUF3179 domain-containing protein [Dehalococcoidia bacterium]|jgi:hypothetical protein|nr:DUF3179 domain-containing protein [Dehalococcoidia bacterium]
MNRRHWLAGSILLVAALAVACGGGDDGTTAEPAAAANAAATPAATSAPESASTPAATAPPDLSDFDRPLSPREEQLLFAIGSNYPATRWETRSISRDELMSGGPGKDGIPSIDDPKFISQEEAAEVLTDGSPVISLEVNGEARAYPLEILIWHEIANDTIGGVPVAVTFCPLCNVAITFDRRVDGEVREFGVSGLLRVSDLVMFDRTNESFWQQITGEAIVGVDTGKQLTFLPSQIVSFADFREGHPDALVLSRDTGLRRRYGDNPYRGYDRIGSGTYFPVPEPGGQLDSKERVLTVEIDGDAVAFPFASLAQHIVIETEVAGRPIVAFWQPGAVSALDWSFIIGSRNIGAAGAFSPLFDGERLMFEARDGAIVDTSTGSVWSVLGKATSGEMAGAELEPLISANHFWFSWSVFKPETRVVAAPAGG